MEEKIRDLTIDFLKDNWAIKKPYLRIQQEGKEEEFINFVVEETKKGVAENGSGTNESVNELLAEELLKHIILLEINDF